MKYGRAFWQHHRSEQLRCASLLVSGLAADLRGLEQCCCCIPCSHCQHTSSRGGPCLLSSYRANDVTLEQARVHKRSSLHMCLHVRMHLLSMHAGAPDGLSSPAGGLQSVGPWPGALTAGALTAAWPTRSSSSSACSAASTPEQHPDLLPAAGQGSGCAAATPGGEASFTQTLPAVVQADEAPVRQQQVQLQAAQGLDRISNCQGPAARLAVVAGLLACLLQKQQVHPS